MGEHYYGPGGEERYDAGLREVRKEHLLPSVTTVLNVVNKYGLNKWKENQIYEACFENPLDPLDWPGPDDEKVAQVFRKWKDEIQTALKIEMNKSAEEGARIHRLFDAWLNATPFTDDNYWILYRAFHDFIQQHKIEPLLIEHSFANYDLGYGGKIDLVCEMDGKHTIIDWKTKDTKGKSSIRLYEEVPMQLAACANGIWKPNSQLCTVIVSRDEPGRIDPPKIWDNGEKHYKAFSNAHQLWCAIKNYNPWTGGKWYDSD